MFDYDPVSVGALKTFLTDDRLKSYLAFAKPQANDRAAIELYVWNTALCAAFYTPIQVVEIALRNAIHREMSAIFGRPDWYSDRTFKRTGPSLVGSLVEVATRLTRSAKPVDPPHMIAGLHFGFWTQLLSPGPDGNYTRSFWNAGLHNAFPQYPGGARVAQRKIRQQFLALKDFRNRVAHHEPIHNKKPDDQYERMLRVAGWIDEILPKWIEHHSECRTMFLEKPC